MLHSDLASHILDWIPEKFRIKIVLMSGWYYAACTVLLGLLISSLVRRWKQGASNLENVEKAKSGCAPFGTMLALAALGTPFAIFVWYTIPPTEASILKNFYAHRATFEYLCDMLQADDGLSRIGTWGVEYKRQISRPPEGEFLLQRFNDYLALLREVGANAAWRDGGRPAEVGIGIWGSGFAGDTVHVDVVWLPVLPSRQVSNFDLFLKNGKSTGTKGWVYRHIDGNWYIGTDIHTK